MVSRTEANSDALRSDRHCQMIKFILLAAKSLYHFRNAIYLMTRREVMARYVGSLAGPLWAIAQPLATVLVFWFVFSLGFKADNASGIPFIVYFLVGYAPWLLVSESLTSSTHSVLRHSYLVKKTVFPVEIIPVVCIATASFTHVILIMMVIVVLLFKGMTLPVTSLQVLYYYVAIIALSIGLSWGLAAVHVFHRDVAHGLNVVLSLWFWITPIVWTRNMIPETLWWVLAYNPMEYIVEGYRQSLIYGIPVWDQPEAMGRFWIIVLATSVSGAHIFRRLKPQFAEAL